MKKIRLTENDLKKIVRKLTEDFEEQPSKENDYKQNSRREVKVNYFANIYLPRIKEIAEIHGSDVAMDVLDEIRSRLSNK
jgi:hypothetical protein